MPKYLLKRLLLFIPTLWAVSLLVFFLSASAPGDPVLQLMSERAGGGDDVSVQEAGYLKARNELGLDQPSFYFALTTAAWPDTFYRIPFKQHRDVLAAFVKEFGNWPEIEAYYHAVLHLKNEIYHLQSDSSNENVLIEMKILGAQLLYNEDIAQTSLELDSLKNLAQSSASTAVLLPWVEKANQAHQQILANATPGKHYWPSIKWYGAQNRYHAWLVRLLCFDFGKSYQDQKPISKKIGEALVWTTGMSLASILLAYLISIPLGVFSARRKDSLADNLTTTGLFALHSMPDFWVASLMIIFLCQPAYLNLFPAFGVGEIRPGMTWPQIIALRAQHLTLPIICWTYASLAYLSRQMRSGLLNVFHEDYIRTARAKGLPERTVVWKHALKNALLPIITLFANVFPRLVVGSFALEIIFNVPGMGKLMVEAIPHNDYPMIFAVVMLTATLTMVGYLIADLLYAVVDPRIRF